MSVGRVALLGAVSVISACQSPDVPPAAEPTPLCDADGDGFDAEGCGGPDCDDASAAVHPGAVDVCLDGLDTDCDPGLPVCGPLSMMNLSQRSGLIPHSWNTNGGIANAGPPEGDGLARLVWAEPRYEMAGALWTGAAPAAGEVVAPPELLLHGEDYGERGFTVRRLGRELSSSPQGWLVGAFGDTADGTLPYLAGSLSWYDGADGLLAGSAPAARLFGAGYNNWIGEPWSYATRDDGLEATQVWLRSRTDSTPSDPWAQQLGVEGDLAELRVWRPATDGTTSVAELPEVLQLDAPTVLGGHYVDFAPGIGELGEDLVVVSSPVPTDGRAPTVYGFPADDPPALLSEAPYQLSVVEDRSGFGKRMRVADVDSDGINDLILPMFRSDKNGEASGALRIVFGPLRAGVPLDAQRNLLWLGENGASRVSRDFPGDEFGLADMVGDIDGDGYADLVVGAPGYDPEGRFRGAIYLFLGPVTEERTASEYDAVIPGWYAGQAAGDNVTALGDLDGDGFDDFGVNSADVLVIVYGGGGT